LAPVLAALRAAEYGKAVSIEMKRPEAGLAKVGEKLALLANVARAGV
jgi:hypothetical protein